MDCTIAHSQVDPVTHSRHCLGALIISTSALLGACGGPVGETAELESVGTTRAEIVNGFVDSGHRQVAQVDPYGVSGRTCTGTLIGRSTVVTAGHCIKNGTGWFGTMVVRGITRDYDPVTQKLVDVPYQLNGVPTVHPNYATSGAAPDVALITLNTPVGGIPLKANLGTSVSAGLPLTLVGFGGTSATDPNWGTTKRYGYNTVDSVDTNYLYYSGATGSDSATCFGDSGGPAFAGGYSSTCMVGITKGQTGTTCVSGTWLHTRIDRVITWIQANAVESVGTCTP